MDIKTARNIDYFELYNIDEKYYQILNESIDVETGEILDEAAFNKFAALESDLESKILELGSIWKNYDAMEISLNNEIKKLKERADKAKKNKEIVGSIIDKAMLGTDKIVSEKTGMEVKRSRSYSVDFTKEIEELHKDYINEKITISADKNKIKKEIKAGGEINGAYLKENINIRVK